MEDEENRCGGGGAATGGFGIDWAGVSGLGGGCACMDELTGDGSGFDELGSDGTEGFGLFARRGSSLRAGP